jgi:hypothetical protein
MICCASRYSFAISPTHSVEEPLLNSSFDISRRGFVSLVFLVRNCHVYYDYGYVVICVPRDSNGKDRGRWKQSMDTNPFLYSFGNAPTDDSTALTVTSTSAQSADVSPILLNEKTDLIRLRFLPKIVTNRTKPANNVEGTFTYERKGKGDDVFPLDCGADFVSRQTVKKDDALKLRLDTNETKNLFEGLKKLAYVRPALIRS